MASNLNSELKGLTGGDRGNAVDGTDYILSPEPVVSASKSDEGGTRAAVLPRTYGTQSLCLMARDPCTLFAYWDINWTIAFGDPAPRERKVHLRILNSDRSEHTTCEVEPMSGSCLVEIPPNGGSFAAELGYHSFGEWRSVATSPEVMAPAAVLTGNVANDSATIPFHLSFQRMLDVLRVPKQKSISLTAMLADLRARSASTAINFNGDERGLVEAMERAAALQAPRSSETAIPIPFWNDEKIERLLGFAPSGWNSGLGGSSHL